MTVIDTHLARLVVAGVSVDPISVSVTMDEGWAPFVQATATLPPDTAVAGADPRTKVRGQISLQRLFGDADLVSELSAAWSSLRLSDLSGMYGGKPISYLSAQHYRPWNSFGMRLSSRRLSDLSMRSRSRDVRTGEITLTFASDEALLQDYALVADSPYMPGYTSVRACVNYALGKIGAALIDGDADGSITADASQWNPGQSAWDWLTPLVQAAGLRLWCDELRAWHLDVSPSTVDGQTTLTVSGSITDATDDTTLDGDWYDAVVITYQWTDAAGTDHTMYDTATNTNWSRVLSLSYNSPYPGPGGAAAVLNRRNAEGDIVTVTAISDYASKPSQALAVTFDDGQRTGQVASVSWDWPAATMQVKSRDVITVGPTAWANGPAGVPWSDGPVGQSWAEHTA